MENQIIYFNRHQSMDSETRETLSDTIRNLRFVQKPDGKYFNSLENYLYGLYDGYNYFLTDNFKKEIRLLMNTDVNLAEEIVNIYSIVNNYEKTENPNNGIF
jgi:hypothetical protein